MDANCDMGGDRAATLAMRGASAKLCVRMKDVTQLDQARGSDDKQLSAGEGVSASSDVAALYSRYRGELVRFLQLHYGSGPPDPEDVVQQAFVNFAGLRDAEIVRNPRAFLFRTVRNLTISLRRHQHITARYAADPAHEILSGEGDEDTPERVYLAREREDLLRRALLALPERRRQMFLMNQVQGQSQDAIAVRFGVSRSAVHKQIVRALRDIEAYVSAALAQGDKEGRP